MPRASTPSLPFALPFVLSTCALACGAAPLSSGASGAPAEPASSSVAIASAAPVHFAPRVLVAPTSEPAVALAPVAAPLATTSEGDERAHVERLAWKARLRWGAECDDGFSPSEGDVGVTVNELGGGKVLVQVLCERGAYNLGTSWFWIDRTVQPERVVQLSFPTYEVPSETVTRAVTSTVLRGLDELDVKRREIRVWRKFRGIGDCGLSARYAVDGGKVRVLDIRAKLACDGEPAEGATMRKLPVPRPR